MQNEFRKYAIKHKGISSTTFDKYTSIINSFSDFYDPHQNNISPKIFET